MAVQGAMGIAWTDRTWNPIRGCSRVSKGCDNCYAADVALRFSGPGQPYEGLAVERNGRPDWTGRVDFIEKHLYDPLRWTKRSMVFVNSMSDLFHPSLPAVHIAAIWAVMEAAAGLHGHVFQVLTKRPERMAMLSTSPEFLALVDDAIGRLPAQYRRSLVRRPENIWPGVSVEDQPSADARIGHLLQTATRGQKWISYEPAIGGVDFWSARYQTGPGRFENAFAWGYGVKWIVVGGESDNRRTIARPFVVDWAYDTIAQAHAGGAAAFVKQLGSRPQLSGALGTRPGERWTVTAASGGVDIVLKNRKGGDPSEWPEGLRVREYPLEAA
jgi:protein gp37